MSEMTNFTFVFISFGLRCQAKIRRVQCFVKGLQYIKSIFLKVLTKMI